MLEVYSARIDSSDPDVFNVTRQSKDPRSHPFAPSWALLSPWLVLRRKARAQEEGARAAGDEYTLKLLDEEHAAAFVDYRERFLQEMRRSYSTNRFAWVRLLERSRVVLVCYCTNGERCHRGILRATILPALGAVDRGEIHQSVKP
jgi:uncharacterized protein YeaO (DUF488 family)